MLYEKVRLEGGRKDDVCLGDNATSTRCKFIPRAYEEAEKELFFRKKMKSVVVPSGA